MSESTVPGKQARTWSFSTLQGGHPRETDLSLFWEFDGDPITDDYLVDEISAMDLWRQWRREYPKDAAAERLFGAGAARVNWYVVGHGVIEGAPFQDRRAAEYPGSHFLEVFTWPTDPGTGERLKWSALPVRDKLWRPGRGDKGGFIQEVTGWKPSPMQAYANIIQLEHMADLTS